MTVTTTFNGRKDGNMAEQEFVVTDWSQDLTLDCNTDDADLGDVLGTLIKVLIDKGIIRGSVTTA